MSEASNQWLTVTEAAARIGVSEKTLRKRIASGAVTAERETLPSGGWAWRVDASSLESSNRSNRREGSATARKGSETEATGSVVEVVTEAVGDDVPTASNRVEEVPAAPLPTVPTDQGTVEMLRDALVREREQTAFLRAQIEAHARSEAELRAALREALRAMPKAIEAPGAQTRQAAPQQPQTDAGAPEAGYRKRTQKDAPQREMRPLWKVVLGIR